MVTTANAPAATRAPTPANAPTVLARDRFGADGAATPGTTCIIGAVGSTPPNPGFDGGVRDGLTAGGNVGFCTAEGKLGGAQPAPGSFVSVMDEP